MVAVRSTMPALGGAAQAFQLIDTTSDKSSVSLADFVDKPLLLMFICNHCPYVIHVMTQLTALANKAQAEGFGVVAISSNDAQSYPQDGPVAMAKFAEDYGFKFPYLYDESQDVAKRYGAACTPDFYVYDNNHRLQYRGQMDDARPGNDKIVSGDYLRAAIEAVSRGQQVSENQIPSVGCNIKWRSGNEPDYF